MHYMVIYSVIRIRLPGLCDLHKLYCKTVVGFLNPIPITGNASLSFFDFNDVILWLSNKLQIYKLISVFMTCYELLDLLFLTYVFRKLL